MFQVSDPASVTVDWAHAARIVKRLIESRGVAFAFIPLPDDEYSIEVKPENGLLLSALAGDES